MRAPDPIPELDLYAELGVDQRASVAAIEAAYRQMLKRHRVKRLNLARHWLSEPHRRTAPTEPSAGTGSRSTPIGSRPRPRVEDLLRVHEARRRRQPPYGGIARAVGGVGIVVGIVMRRVRLG